MFQVKFGPMALNFGSDLWAPVFWFTNYNSNNNYFFWDTLSVFSPSVLGLPKIPLDRVKLGETKKRGPPPLLQCGGSPICLNGLIFSKGRQVTDVGAGYLSYYISQCNQTYAP